jgi:hypothetical protein
MSWLCWVKRQSSSHGERRGRVGDAYCTLRRVDGALNPVPGLLCEAINDEECVDFRNEVNAWFAKG